MHNDRENAAIAKIALTANIIINYSNTKKLENINDRNYTFCREAIEIISNKKTCNTIQHFSADQEWQRILKDDNIRKKENL